MRTAAQVRQDFLDFFISRHDHSFVPSSPVIPHDDPTLLFANAGMNQFKPCFLGTAPAGSELARLKRAANTQKCIRAGGKHNDLDDVGTDTYHHTFFEMLGNWSFGDYFKREAIAWAWDLLTNVWGLEKDRLYATVFGGDEELGLPPDEEAERLWKDVTDIDPRHVRRFGKKDNFWEMGEVGPCGPCSEIHYDGTPDVTGGKLVNADHPDVIEIWNLVFIQFERLENGSLKPLPAKHVDTGMGFERIVRVLQGKTSNYDTDLWTPLFEEIRSVTGARPYGGVLDDPIDIAYRIIADHIRTLTFAIADGAQPGNEGRGYVLRRILRRAVRHGRQTLGVKGVFFADLVGAVVRLLGDTFPELTKNPQHVIDVIRDEEESFGRTLDRGIALFEQAAKREQTTRTKRISGEDAFLLHDTYGFPIDLTQIMAQERGLEVDLQGYEERMEEARQLARAAGQGGSAAARLALSTEALSALKVQGIDPTDDAPKFSGFECKGRIVSIWDGDQFVERAHPSTGADGLIGVITDRTPFYAAMGGQIGDTGVITRDGARFHVADTQPAGDYVLHIGRVTSGHIGAGDAVQMSVDAARRRPIMANHTATHMLNRALREVLGDHIEQKGSLVAEDRLRFDFSHNKALSHDELTQVQHLVNQDINAALRVYWDNVPLEKAKRIHGVRAVFGEVYPDPVRVVSIGVPVDDLIANPHHEKWRHHSIEFCGGTHLGISSDAANFVIVSEEAVAKGIRRIVALTGAQATAARDKAMELRERLHRAGSLPVEQLAQEVASLNQALDQETLPVRQRMELSGDLEELQTKVKAAQKQAAASEAEHVLSQARELAGSLCGPALVTSLQGASGATIRSAMDVFKAKHPDSAVLLASADAQEGKVAIMAHVPESLIKRGLKAGDWVRHAAEACGGKGGGRPDSAQAGGKEPSKLPEALQAARAFADEKLQDRK